MLAVTHEFGHYHGLDHVTANTMMHPVGVFDGTLFRYLFGDDTAGVISSSLPYGGYSNLIYARAISTADWGAEIGPVLSSPVMANATVAKRNGTDFGVLL